MLDSLDLVLSSLHGEVWLMKGSAQNAEKIGLLSVKFGVILRLLIEACETKY